MEKRDEVGQLYSQFVCFEVCFESHVLIKIIETLEMVFLKKGEVTGLLI